MFRELRCKGRGEWNVSRLLDSPADEHCKLTGQLNRQFDDLGVGPSRLDHKLGNRYRQPESPPAGASWVQKQKPAILRHGRPK